MDQAIIPDNEAARIAALQGLEVLDTPAEERFDRITRIAQKHFCVPIVLVSLVDFERQWFKSRQGLDVCETPRDISFCGHTILGGQILCVPNTLEDPRFADNPLVVGPPEIRFYAGAPLHAPTGERVGTLCLIDREPRVFLEDDLSVLRDLADIVESELGRVRLLQIQTELADKEQQLQQLIALSPGVIYTCKASDDYCIHYISPQVKAALGHRAEDFLANPQFWFEHIHPEDRSRVVDQLKTANQQPLATVDYRFLQGNGEYCWLHDTRHLVEDHAGNPSEIVGLWIDITARKELELESKYYRAIVESSADAIISKTLDGIISSWNPAAETIFGYTADEAIGQPIQILFPADRVDEEQDIYQQLLQGKKVEHFQSVRRHKNGSLLDISLTISPIVDEAGHLLGASKIVRNITGSKESERKLADSEARIRAIVENVIDGIITIDDKGIVQTINPAAERIFGFSADEVLGCNVSILMPSPYRQEHDSYLANYLTTGDKKIIGIGREVVGQRKNGTTFPMDLSVSEMLVNGKRMFTGIVRDISERKEIERVKSEFVSTVSHELRTPLTSIRGALGLMLGRMSSQLPEKAQELLAMANRNSERLTLLINDLLDLEKIESGKLEFENTIVDLSDLARRAIEDNAGFAHEHGVELVLNNEVEQALVSGDEHRLQQVLANLISNGVKYSATGGTVEVGVVTANGSYRVLVRDHGEGIPEAFRGQIFQRFAQADSSDSREKGGTGLGLSICKAIIERHGGVIDFESTLGEGACFYFDLPALAAVIYESQVQTMAVRVLICEDNLDVGEILKEMVESEGITCDITGTLAAARELMARHRYQLLLLDLILPDGNGLEFLEELRNDSATAMLPVIVVSGCALEGRKAFQGDAVAVVDWLQKPVDQQRLKLAITEALKRVERPRILHIEDDSDIVQIVYSLLCERADITATPSVEGARRLLREGHFDLVVLDISLADGSGLDILNELKNMCPVVIFSTQVPHQITSLVHAALSKSNTSYDQLKTTIFHALGMSYNGMSSHE